MRGKHKSEYSGQWQEKVCPICGKGFLITDVKTWAYKDTGRKGNKFYCSYHCKLRREKRTANERLRELRKENGMRQKDLAEKIGMTANAYHYIEVGVTRPSREKCEEICRVLGVELHEIFGAI